MEKKYLFSPVGNTDPIKYFHDGSLLHICRHYLPDVVYLYLSKEMLENHKKDNRYVKTLELLGEALHHDFEVHVIEAPEMVQVQQYDVFYNEFRKIIGEIEAKKGKEEQLLLNMASGTPSMKSALLVMATLAEYRFLPIQVSTPKKESNLEHEERKEYDVVANWELNQDNEIGAENRCVEVRCINLMRLLKIDIIKKHLLSYDYSAALEVGKDIREDLSSRAFRWLEAAEARSSLNWEKMNLVLPEKNRVLSVIKENSIKKILFEYTLVLDLKVRRKEYADFIRAITPLGVDLLEIVLEQYCDVEIQKYYANGNIRKWSRSKLKGTEMLRLLQGEYLQFNFGPVYSAQLNNVIQKKCSSENLAKRVQDLVDVEHNVRNIAAHNIVSATPDWVKEKTGKSISEIMGLIKYICEQVKINLRKENWDSYDLMNQEIIKELDQC